MPRAHSWRQWEKVKATLYERTRARYLERLDDIVLDLKDACFGDVPEDYHAQAERLLAQWLRDWREPARVRNKAINDTLDPRKQIATLAGQLTANHERISALIENWADRDPTITDAQTYRIFVDTAERLQRQIDALHGQMTVEDQWAADHDEWFALKAQIKKRIFRDYRGKGEVYNMLCDRLAALQVGLNRLEKLGRIATDQYKDINEQFVACAAQLQRHTESTKVEDVSATVQQIGEKFMAILEGKLALTQPTLLVDIQTIIWDNLREDRFQPGVPLRLLEAKDQPA